MTAEFFTAVRSADTGRIRELLAPSLGGGRRRGARERQRAPVAPPSRLVVSGQYRHVRNPMYVAVVAIVLGQALVLGSLVLLRYGLVVWLLFHAFVLLYEEPALRARFGSSYEVYRHNVRRWWPRIRPWSG